MCFPLLDYQNGNRSIVIIFRSVFHFMLFVLFFKKNKKIINNGQFLFLQTAGRMD